MYQLISTVGLEYEVETLEQHDMMSRLNSSIFKQTHDASIESDASYRSGIYVKAPRELFVGRGMGTTIGTEIISIPFDTEGQDMLPHLKNLTQILMEMGEPEKSFRAGIHIHVNMSYNLRILKSMIRLGANMEDVFFYIGTQGYMFRGMKVNDNAYCRPITKFGPQCVRTGNGNYQVFNIKDLLEAKTVQEFWWRYGSLSVTTDNNMPGGGWGRYVPQRYTWLNLYSLLLHSTVEFRVFNKTMSPFKINAEIKLCQKFCEFAIRNGFSELKDLGFLGPHSIYDNRPRGEIVETFDKFAEMVELDTDSYQILRNTILSAPEVHFPEQYIWSHLEPSRSGWWGQRDYGETRYAPPHISSDLIITPNVIDIHTIRGERRPN
jgi:hypothetical protein